MTDKPLKDVYSHGDSLDVIRGFPRAVRVDIGGVLYLLQLGKRPLHSKPFSKKTQKTRKSDIELGKSRFRELQRKK